VPGGDKRSCVVLAGMLSAADFRPYLAIRNTQAGSLFGVTIPFYDGT